MTLSQEVKERAIAWTDTPFDLKTRKEVLHLLQKNPGELEERFSEDLSFGTGGMRALMGVGSNRFNCYTVRKATKGLANYLHKECSKERPSVVIGFDNRFHSEEFAKEAMETLTASGIDVFLFKHLRPTPVISFACRHLKAHAAIMITASHNPKEYNGYKVYWSDGAQVVPPHDKGIMEEVSRIQDFSLPLHEAKGSCTILEEEIDKAYLQAISPLKIPPKAEVNIVYTSLHGTGASMIPKALDSWGFPSVSLVKEQVIVDGAFPTVELPNPEYASTLSLGIKQMEESGADLLLASDPDADRLGVSLLHKGKTVILNGNETAAICLEFLASHKKPKGSSMVTSIVSSPLLDVICKENDIQCFRVLTGFKYIGEKIHQWENLPDAPLFLFGAEESYGYLYGTHARDKDAVVMSCLIASIASTLKAEGKTLVDALEAIFTKYGVFKEGLASLGFSADHAGALQKEKIMQSLRTKSPKTINGVAVTEVTDYLLTDKTDLPSSDVLAFTLEDHTRFIIRPSGTEPKIKLYVGVKDSSTAAAKERLSSFLSAVKSLCEKI